MKLKVDALNKVHATLSWGANSWVKITDSWRTMLFPRMAFVKEPGHCSGGETQHLELGLLKAQLKAA